MKKRLLSVLLSVAIGFTPLLAGCGNVSDASSEEEEVDAEDDEEDEDADLHDDDEDEEDEDETSPEPVFVRQIDPETLISQISVFLDEKDHWAYNDGNDSTLYRMGYFVTDLDHNGRAELTVTRELDSMNITIDKTYEINEDGDGLVDIEYVFPDRTVGKDKTPDFYIYDRMDSYFVKETGEVHYLTVGLFDNGNGNYGAMYYDFVKSSDAMTFDPYLTISSQEIVDQETYESSYEYKYYSGSREVTEKEYSDLMDSYTEGAVVMPVTLGIMVRFKNADMYLEDDDDVYLKNALYDSYMVFTGDMDPFVFSEDYNDPAGGVFVNEDLFADAVGSWALYSSEIEGDVTYYDQDSPIYMTVDIYDDLWVFFTGRKSEGETYSFDSELYEQEGYPSFMYDIYAETGEANEYGEVRWTYLINDVYYDGESTYMEVYFDSWGEEGWLTGSVLTFVLSQG